MGPLTKCRFVIDVSEDDAISNEQDLSAFRLVAIQMPADWTAADIAFYSRPRLDPGDGGNATSQLAFVIQVAADTYRVLTEGEQAMSDGLWMTKLVSVDHASLPDEEAQGADRALIAVLAPRG